MASTSSSVATLINDIINEQNSCKMSKDSISKSDAQVVQTNQNQTYRLISSLNHFSSSIIKIEDTKSKYPLTPSDLNDEIVIKTTDTIRDISDFKFAGSKDSQKSSVEINQYHNIKRLNKDIPYYYKKNTAPNPSDNKLLKSKSSYILPKPGESGELQDLFEF